MWLVALLSGVILVLAGVGFLCFGLVSVVGFGALPFALSRTVPGVEQGAVAVPSLFGAGFSAIFVVVGLVMVVGGGALVFVGIRMRRKLQERIHRLMEQGREAEATITFVDRNFAVLVNNRPIYSIVEYTFRDGMGREHVGRMENVSSDYVIRNKLEVGSAIRVKYLADDPAESMVLEE